MVYKIFRAFYVVLWFYFLPFTVILFSFAIPLLIGNKNLFDGDEITVIDDN